MKRFLPLLFVLFAVGASAADLNPSVRLPDNSQSITVNYRDRGTATTSHAQTYNVESNYSYSQTASTKTVSAIAGLLHAITITDSVATAFIVYDSTHTGDTTRPIAKFEASAAAGTYLFDVQVTSGIQHIGAASGAEVTFSYR